MPIDINSMIQAAGLGVTPKKAPAPPAATESVSREAHQKLQDELAAMRKEVTRLSVKDAAREASPAPMSASTERSPSPSPKPTASPPATGEKKKRHYARGFTPELASDQLKSIEALAAQVMANVRFGCVKYPEGKEPTSVTLGRMKETPLTIPSTGEIDAAKFDESMQALTALRTMSHKLGVDTPSETADETIRKAQAAKPLRQNKDGSTNKTDVKSRDTIRRATLYRLIKEAYEKLSPSLDRDALVKAYDMLHKEHVRIGSVQATPAPV